MNGMPWSVLRREWSLLIGTVLLVTLEVSHVLDWLVLQNSALVLVRPISGRVSELDGLMLLTVAVVWVALQVV